MGLAILSYQEILIIIRKDRIASLSFYLALIFFEVLHIDLKRDKITPGEGGEKRRILVAAHENDWGVSTYINPLCIY